MLSTKNTSIPNQTFVKRYTDTLLKLRKQLFYHKHNVFPRPTLILQLHIFTHLYSFIFHKNMLKNVKTLKSLKLIFRSENIIMHRDAIQRDPYIDYGLGEKKKGEKKTFPLITTMNISKHQYLWLWILNESHLLISNHDSELVFTLH